MSFEPGVLEPHLIEQLRALETASGTPVLAQVIRMFLEELPARLSAVRAAAAARDPAALERAAHALRGSAAALGATRVRQVCAALEQQAEAKLLRDPDGLVGKLEAEVELARAALQDMQGA